MEIAEEKPQLSVVLPCLNEEEALGACIRHIQRVFAERNIQGEIVVCDNGSTDRSVPIAEGMGVRVVHEPRRGYGRAYLTGFRHARGKYLIMADADGTYDFDLIPRVLEHLQNQGFDFVTGSRYLEGGHKRIRFLHRFFGNPLLTSLLNVLFGTRYTDVYCGFRGFTRDAYERIRPVSPGMEYNLELAINAGLAGLSVSEIPIALRARKGKSKLRTFRDGWRSLRMMLLYSPNKLFLWPGAFLFSLGMLTHGAVLTGLVHFRGERLGAVTSILAMVSSVLGFQILSLGLHAKTYSWGRRFDRENLFLKRFYDVFKLEVGLLFGFFMMMVGGFILLLVIIPFLHEEAPPLGGAAWTSLGATFVIIGVGVIFTSLFISAMSMKKEGDS